MIKLEERGVICEYLKIRHGNQVITTLLFITWKVKNVERLHKNRR